MNESKVRPQADEGIISYSSGNYNEYRRNLYINYLQKPISEIIGRTLDTSAIDFNDEEWLRNIIRSYPDLEEIYQEIKRNVVNSVSMEYLGNNIERDLLEQEFTSILNAPSNEKYLEKLSEAIKTLLKDFSVNNQFEAQNAYDYLNVHRRDIKYLVESKKQVK